MLKRASALILVIASLALIACGRAGRHEVEVVLNTPTPIPTAAVTAVPEGEETPAPTEAPTEAPTAEPAAEPTAAPALPTAVPAQHTEPKPAQQAGARYVVFKCRVNKVNIRAEANTHSDIVGTVGYEEPVKVLGFEGDFLRIEYRGKTRYCYADYFVPEGETLYGYKPAWSEYKTDKEGNTEYEDDGVTPVVLHSELIDVRLLIPDIEIYQIFGTDKNFTGTRLYMRSVPVMQLPAAFKLAEAARAFAADGYTIKLYDCYRPKSVQFILYDIVGDSRYIANPYNSASNHNRAAAVDMTLIGPDGVELEFPTPMHTFGKIVHRSSSGLWTAEQNRNVDYMTEVMVSCGFKTITTEWWHFSDTDYPDYVVMDIDMRDIPMYTAAEVYEMAGLAAYGVPRPAGYAGKVLIAQSHPSEPIE